MPYRIESIFKITTDSDSDVIITLSAYILHRLIKRVLLEM